MPLAIFENQRTRCRWCLVIAVCYSGITSVLLLLVSLGSHIRVTGIAVASTTSDVVWLWVLLWQWDGGWRMERAGVACGTVTGRLKSCMLSLWGTRVVVMGNRVGGGTSAVPSVPTTLCFSVHHFQLYRCVDLSSVLVCWVRRLC